MRGDLRIAGKSSVVSRHACPLYRAGYMPFMKSAVVVALGAVSVSTTCHVGAQVLEKAGVPPAIVAQIENISSATPKQGLKRLTVERTEAAPVGVYIVDHYFSSIEKGLLQEKTVISSPKLTFVQTQLSFLGFLPLVSTTESTSETRIALGTAFSGGGRWGTLNYEAPFTSATTSRMQITALKGDIAAIGQLPGSSQWSVEATHDNVFSIKVATPLVSRKAPTQTVSVAVSRECKLGDAIDAQKMHASLRGRALLMTCAAKAPAAAFTEEWAYLEESMLFFLRSSTHPKSRTENVIKEVEYFQDK